MNNLVRTALHRRWKNTSPVKKLPTETASCRMLSAVACHYNALGIRSSAGKDEIRRAFLALARNHHPDVSAHVGAEGRFKAISAAYEVLGNPSARADYDGRRGLQGEFFGRSPGYGMRSRPRPQPRARPRRSDGSEMPFLEGLLVAMMYIVPFGGLFILGVETLKPVGEIRDNSLYPICYNPKTRKWEEYNIRTMNSLKKLKVRWVSKDQLLRRQAAETNQDTPHVMESVPNAFRRRKIN